MEYSDKPFGHAWGKAGLACSWTLAIITSLALSMNFALAQEDADTDADAEEDEEALELQDVKVTGSRLNRAPSELSGNLIVLDGEAIRASGELTLARVLRQLPQNINATNETYGSRLNGAANRTGGATVNLRGLGSESTLILLDGRRIGYSGLFGGVTDISTIPLSMVDRIEILLDGASAVYGSDAVGGVVNIITRKDYSGIELDLNYGRPHRSGYDESRANISTGWAWSGGRASIGYEYFRDSGLDASLRDSIIWSRSRTVGAQKYNQPYGPQLRLTTNDNNDNCSAANALVYELDGNILSRDEFAALNPDSQAMATCHVDITLPSGFQYTDDFNGISLFGLQDWGDSNELGFSLRPEQSHNVVNVGIDQEVTQNLSVRANVRWGTKDSSSNDGQNWLNGTLNQGNPFNPFGVNVFLYGLTIDTPPKSFESERDELFIQLGVDGSLGSWTWQAEFNRSSEEIHTSRINYLSNTYGPGIRSDGVTEARIASLRSSIIPSAEACEEERIARGGTRYTYEALGFFGFYCRIYAPPPDPINPFGDLNYLVIPSTDYGSENEQSQFEALARGELFNAPGGPIALVVGYDFRQDILDSFSEGGQGLLSAEAPVPNSFGTKFDTKVSRDNHAAFLEGLIPLVGSNNAMTGVQRLSLTLSARYDSYSNVEIDYRDPSTGEADSVEAADPGSSFTWSTGVVYRPADSMLFRANLSTSFVAPQLNQLLSRVTDLVPGCFGIWVDSTETSASQFCNNVFVYNGGGNDKLVPETADSLGLSGEFSPAFLPGFFLKVSWSNTEFTDRIAKLTTSITHRDDLPSTITYLPDDDIYIRDDRYINVKAIDRSGIDLEMRYEWETGLNDYAIIVRRSYTNKYDIQRDPKDPENSAVHDLVTTKVVTASDNPLLSAVPRHQTSAQFTWTRGGLFVSFDIQGADTTETLNDRSFRVWKYVTEPATNYDLVLSYDFSDNSLFDAPAWMNGLSTSVTVNNLTNAFAENFEVDLETGERIQYLASPFYEWTQGRSYRLTIHKSF